MSGNERKRSRDSMLAELRHAYSIWLRTALLALGVLLGIGLLFIGLYLYNPEHTLADLYLNLGAAFVTGAVFSLILPAFLSDPQERSKQELPIEIFEAVSNRFDGLGRVWPIEDAFIREFDMERVFANRSWKQAVFIGMSLRRFLVLYERVIVASYQREQRSKWPTLSFVIPDPEGQFALSHVRTGPEDVISDIQSTITKVEAMKNAIAVVCRCRPDQVPIRIHKTRTPIRFGLYYFEDANDILTLYRYGSQSYSNPKIEIVYRQRDSGRTTPLGEWIEGYIDLLETERKSG